MLFIADAMRDSPNNPVVGLVDQVPPSGPGMPIPWPRWSFCCGMTGCSIVDLDPRQVALHSPKIRKAHGPVKITVVRHASHGSRGG